jgi:excisionase family DNA binding protein
MIRVRILKNRGARVTRPTRHGDVERFVAPNGYIRVDEAAAFLGVTLNRIYRRIESGTLKADKREGAWTVALADVKALKLEGP